MLLQSHHKKTVRRISLTPLADLVFILLVFFILETSFTQFREVGYNVPEQKEQGQSAGELLTLELFADGKLWAQGAALTLQVLGAYLDEQQFVPETTVLLKVQDKVPLQLMIKAMDQLKARQLLKIQILALDNK